jgi:hypothetical protein
MSLEIKEVRGSSTCHAYRDGYKEVTRETQTRFHWKLFGIVSELDAAAVKSPDFDLKDQELYNVVFASQAFDLGACLGFGSREVAIRNAVEFAERNGIEIDGYEAIEDKENTHA